MGNGEGDGKPVRASRGKGDKGPGKTTVDKTEPVTITPKNAEYVVVLDKTGATPAAYPVLEFQVTGPHGWFFEVQVSRHESNLFTEAPGLTGSWDKSKDWKDRLPQKTFSSWTNGEKTLKLDGSGKGKYTMPLDWWKDQARLPRKDFSDEDFYYRAIAYKDAAGSAPRFSTPNGGTPPSLKIHNNLRDFKASNVGYVDSGGRQQERLEFTVREANTTEMYTIVQWMQGAIQLYSGTTTSFLQHQLYNIQHDSNFPDRTIDSLTTNPRPSFFGGAGSPQVSPDHKTAFGTDGPGASLTSLPGSYTALFFSVDFETHVHLNFEVIAPVNIIRQDGSPPRYGVITGMLSDPQPATLDTVTWKARILWEKQADGTLNITYPDTYTPGAVTPPAPKGSCFIATAAYGSELAPEVQFLREIRDHVLRRTEWGLKFFDAYWKYYYRFSPPLAEEMKRDPEMNRVVRWSIVEPWTYFLRLAIRRPDWDRIDFDALDPELRRFLEGLRTDMDRWLEAIEVPRSFDGHTPARAVEELNIALGLVLRTGGLRYLNELVACGALPLRYAPDEEEALTEMLRRAGRKREEIGLILHGTCD